MSLLDEKEYNPKVEDAKLEAAGWREVYIGLWKKENTVFVLDTNAIVGVVYHHSYMGFDGGLFFFYEADEALKWMADNELKYQNYE